MSTEHDLRARSDSRCELCGAPDDLAAYPVPPGSDGSADQCVLLCSPCRAQVEGSSPMESDHWRPLTGTMWSQFAPVQVMAWRMLRRLRSEAWASEALDTLYL